MREERDRKWDVFTLALRSQLRAHRTRRDEPDLTHPSVRKFPHFSSRNQLPTPPHTHSPASINAARLRPRSTPNVLTERAYGARRRERRHAPSGRAGGADGRLTQELVARTPKVWPVERCDRAFKIRCKWGRGGAVASTVLPGHRPNARRRAAGLRQLQQVRQERRLYVRDVRVDRL